MIKFEKIKGDIKQYFSQVAELLSGDNNVVLAYLFGSYGRDDVGPLSDVDIAVLLDESCSEGKYLDKQLELMADIGHILGTNEVDLVILNEAPVDLSYSVIESGKALYCRDGLSRVCFETLVTEKYLDTARMRKEYFYFLRKQIGEGRMFNGHRLKKHQRSLEQIKRMFGQTGAS